MSGPKSDEATSLPLKSGLHEMETELSSLMIRSLKGDTAAYRLLLERIRVVLKAYQTRALRKMGIHDPEACEDLLQEALLAIHVKRHTFDPGQLFTPWMFAIARYKLIDYSRRIKSRGTSVNWEDLEDILVTAESSSPRAEADLEAMMKELPPKQRTALDLVKLQGLSVAEASLKTQTTESSVKVNVHRAIKTLRLKIRTELERNSRKSP